MSTDPISTLGMTGSYNENSDPQLAIIMLMSEYIEIGVDQLDVSNASSPLTICDYGSSQGRNSIIAMKIFLKYLKEANKLVRPPLIVHNDLPTNDWIRFFQLLAEDKSYQGVASGISFYEQCLPSNSLSMGFTASSLHWLSKIPFNLSNHCFHTYAKPDEQEAYKNQAKKDLTTFIEHRANELVQGGVLVLSIPSVNDEGRESISNYFDQLYYCAEKLFTKEELSKFTVPIYLRSLTECVDHQLFHRCSLQLIKVEISQLKVPTLDLYHNGQLTFDQLAKIFTKVFQSTMETLVEQILKMHGRPKEEIDLVTKDFWDIYEEKLKEKPELVINENQYICTCLILKKI